MLSQVLVGRFGSAPARVGNSSGSVVETDQLERVPGSPEPRDRGRGIPGRERPRAARGRQTGHG